MNGGVGNEIATDRESQREGSDMMGFIEMMTQTMVRPRRAHERGMRLEGGGRLIKVRKLRVASIERINGLNAPTLHPCISETPNANRSFPPDSDFLVVTVSESRLGDYQHTINSNPGKIDGNETKMRVRGGRGAEKPHPRKRSRSQVGLRPI